MSSAMFRADCQPLALPGGMDLHARDMTATFAADASLREAQRRLAELDQWLPIDGDPDAAIGRHVEQNSTGPLRLGYGAWRDLLLGVQFQNGRGELISAGGRVVKNVAGYDLTKFMAGSGGIFGAIKTLTARTWRRPAGALLARHAPDVRILNRLMPTALRPQWAMLTADEMLLGYLGDDPTTAFFRHAVRQSEPLEVREWSVEEDVQFRAERWRMRGPMAVRASVPPTRISEFIRAVSAFPSGEGNGWVADAAFGIVLGSNIAESHTEIIRKAAESVGGSAKFFDDGGTLCDLSTNPVERQIIERLKVAFDPDNTLKPLPWQTR